jgi:uncharacterized protein (TIGR02145 family)
MPKHECRKFHSNPQEFTMKHFLKPATHFAMLLMALATSFTFLACGEHSLSDIFGDLLGNSSSSYDGSGGGASSGGGFSGLVNSLVNSGMNFTDSQTIPNGNESVITGVQFIAADENSPYGTVIFTSSEELAELYLQIDGENGFYTKSLTSSNIADFSNRSYAYSVDLDFAPGLNADKQSVKVSGKSIQGKVSEPKDSENSLIDKLDCNGNVQIFGDYAGFIGNFDMGVNSGSFKFEYATYDMPDEITIYSDSKARGAPVFHYPSGSTEGWEQTTVNFSERNITIKVIGSGAGTGWDFKVHCPAGVTARNPCGTALSTSRFTDSRDGKVYGTVKIGSQTWMSKNLDYNAPGSWCYNKQNSNCDKYGRLYNWAAASTACPGGWHLPNVAEWDTLSNNSGSRSNPGSRFVAGRCLKAASGWSNNGNGQDACGFAAIPGGSGFSSDDFNGAGDFGDWWSSSESSSDYAYARGMYYMFDYIGWNDQYKNYLFSVRCIQD